MHKPVIYQEIAGCASRSTATMRSGTAIGWDFSWRLDTRRALVIDPVLVYSTYLGGSDIDIG